MLNKFCGEIYVEEFNSEIRWKFFLRPPRQLVSHKGIVFAQAKL